MDNIENRLADSDLSYCLEYNPQSFKEEDIKHMPAAVYGANDEDNWFWIVELKDGRFFLISGGCDYTGWGCQDWGDSWEVKSAMDGAIMADSKKSEYDNRKISEALINQLTGKQPFGTIITDRVPH